MKREPLLSKEGYLRRTKNENATSASPQMGWSWVKDDFNHYSGRAEIVGSVASLFGAATPPSQGEG
jgi:hypothetical protein